ncbi:hypothetical protein PENTCL1PPCAC_29010, partial [Pristionchus entomophagus]
LERLEEWKGKTCEYEIQTDDAFAPLISKTFDVLSAMNKTPKQPVQIDRSLDVLDIELSNFLTKEDVKKPLLRSLMFGIIETFHMTFRNGIISRPSSPSHPNDETLDASQSIPSYNQTPLLDFMAGRTIKEEAQNDDVTSQLSDCSALTALTKCSNWTLTLSDDGDVEEPSDRPVETATEIVSNSLPEEAEAKEFAQSFKQKRIALGFTQADIGNALRKHHGPSFSQGAIQRFESLNLTVSNLCKFAPFIKKWLEETELAIANGASAADLGATRPIESSASDFMGGRNIKLENILNDDVISQPDEPTLTANAFNESSLTDPMADEPTDGTTFASDFMGGKTVKEEKMLIDDAMETSSAIVSMSNEEEKELKSYAKSFKNKRVKLGFSQADIGNALRKRYGISFCQSVVQRFEARTYTTKYMLKFGPRIKKWMEEVESAIANGANRDDFVEKTPPVEQISALDSMSDRPIKQEKILNDDVISRPDDSLVSLNFTNKRILRSMSALDPTRGRTIKQEKISRLKESTQSRVATANEATADDLVEEYPPIEQISRPDDSTPAEGNACNEDSMITEESTNGTDATHTAVEISKEKEMKLRKFAAWFRIQREKLGFTQIDVAKAIKKTFGADFETCSTTIHRFENFNIAIMHKFRPVIKKWLDHVATAIANGASPADFGATATRPIRQTVSMGRKTIKQENMLNDVISRPDDSTVSLNFTNKRMLRSKSLLFPVRCRIIKREKSVISRPDDSTQLGVNAGSNSPFDDDDAPVNRTEVSHATFVISYEEEVELQQFAELFKQKRKEFGFTQADVANALTEKCGLHVGGMTIHRFEAWNLSAMYKYRPLIKEWLEEA